MKSEGSLNMYTAHHSQFFEGNMDPHEYYLNLSSIEPVYLSRNINKKNIVLSWKRFYRNMHVLDKISSREKSRRLLVQQ